MSFYDPYNNFYCIDPYDKLTGKFNAIRVGEWQE